MSISGSGAATSTGLPVRLAVARREVLEVCAVADTRHMRLTPSLAAQNWGAPTGSRSMAASKAVDAARGRLARLPMIDKAVDLKFQRKVV